jgi:mono/diheme cytochrome c family protein
MLRFGMVVAAGLAATMGTAFADDVSVAIGERISIVGGCHDCHTVGYAESGGNIDPSTALMGNPVGYAGPWGVNYAKNLRIDAGKMSENDWVGFLQNLKVGPPMPWFNVHALTEAEMRSLYQYIKSLGDPGDPAPTDVPPGQKPTTPFVTMAPPTMPG